MEMPRIISIILLLLMLPGFTIAKSDVCYVNYYFVDKDPFASSSNHRLGSFPIKFDEDQNEVTKELYHNESGSTVHVGAERRKSVFKDDPYRLRIAIAFDLTGETIFSEFSRSEAESIFDKNWKSLSVSKGILIGKREYTFKLVCERQNDNRR